MSKAAKYPQFRIDIVGGKKYAIRVNNNPGEDKDFPDYWESVFIVSKGTLKELAAEIKDLLSEDMS